VTGLAFVREVDAVGRVSGAQIGPDDDTILKNGRYLLNVYIV
jgi:hypothetical protein